MRGLGDLFEVPDLRRRILFTLGAIAVFRVGAAIPIPGVNGDAIRAIFAAREVPARMSWQLGEALLYIVEERSKRMAESGRLALVSALVLIGTDVQQGLCADCRVLDAFPDLLRADGALTREAEMWITSHRAVWNKHRCQVMRWLLALCRLEIGTFQYDDAFGDFDAGEHPRCDHKRFLKSVRGAFRGHDEVRSLIHRILG